MLCNSHADHALYNESVGLIGGVVSMYRNIMLSAVKNNPTHDENEEDQFEVSNDDDLDDDFIDDE